MTEIKLDFDKPNRPDFHRIYCAVRILYLHVTHVRITKSKHGGTHVVLFLSDTITSPIYITCLQAICGSDWKRESFNLIRASMIERGEVDGVWKENWNVLFKADESTGRDNKPRKGRMRGNSDRKEMGS